MIFNYAVSGLKGSVLPNFQPIDEPILIEVEAEKISDATEKIKDYFYKNLMIAERIKLLSIKLK